MNRRLLLCLVLVSSVFIAAEALAAAPPATNPQNGGIGVGGRIPSSAPNQAPTITTPANGASFTTLPIRVAGLCNSSYLVEIFKNNVFSGSTQCANGSYSLQIDLFSGKNDLVAKQFDDLNQSSPDSSMVSVNFNDQIAASGPRISLTTAYAKRGADPNAELSWPLTLSGGTQPYAVEVDWGDGSDSQLLSEKFAGDFNISHTYQQSGSYNVTIKASDASEQAAFLQVVAIANGKPQQSTSTSSGSASSSSNNSTAAKVYWPPIVVLAVIVPAAFWLGSRHQMSSIKSKLRQGNHPF